VGESSTSAMRFLVWWRSVSRFISRPNLAAAERSRWMEMENSLYPRDRRPVPEQLMSRTSGYVYAV
jgi:hypothetical protein